MIVRKFIESPLRQGEDEKVAYALTTTPWGASPTSVTVKIFSLNATTGAKTDVSSTKLSGVVAVVGNVITTPLVQSLIPGTHYRLEITFSSSGNTFEAWGIIEAEA